MKPDLPTPAASALKVAHQRALRALLKEETDAHRRQALEQTLALLESGDDRRPDYTRRD